MHMEENSLVFKPFVPEILKGERTLNNFKYRNAILNISLNGYGNVIQSITLDGADLPAATVAANLSGTHQVVIILANNSTVKDEVGLVKDYFSLAAPVIKHQDMQISWEKVEGAVNYKVICNGKEISKTTSLSYTATVGGEYQLIAVDAAGVASFASEPLLIYAGQKIKRIDLTLVADKSDLNYQGYTGKGFIEISKTKNRQITIGFDVPEEGSYAIDFRYSNGNGPTNTENKCAIRTFNIDDKFAGTFVFPQRGKEEWSDWGFSNTHVVQLSRGKHQFSLSFEHWNENMNGEINQAMLDYLRVIRIN